MVYYGAFAMKGSGQEAADGLEIHCLLQNANDFKHMAFVGWLQRWQLSDKHHCHAS